MQKTVELSKIPIEDHYFRELIKSLIDKDILKESTEGADGNTFGGSTDLSKKFYIYT